MAANCYITFSTVYYAIRSESILKDQPYSFKMVPVPRSISSSCGTALRCACPDVESIKDYLLQHGLDLEGLFRLEEQGLKKPVVIALSLDRHEVEE